MPRKAYNADLAEAQQRTFVNVNSIQAISDGELTFEFKTGGDNALITVMIPEVSEYPSGHEVMTFAADDAPAWVAALLEDTPQLSGKSVSQILTLLSKSLSRVAMNGNGADATDDDGDLVLSDYASADSGPDFDEDDEDEPTFRDGFGDTPEPETRHAANAQAKEAFESTLRRDLIAVKEAGFKVGHIGPFPRTGKCTFAISIKVSKLGISEEALNTWLVEEDDYLVLLIQYRDGYRPLKELVSGERYTNTRLVEFKTCLCKKYKPTIDEVATLFHSSSNHGNVSARQSSTKIRATFISRPLDALLNDRLISIIKYRVNQGMNWDRAEDYFNESQGKFNASSSFHYSQPDYESYNPALPLIVTCDELRGHNGSLDYSFPLIAMQFLLRHFVRCTEFCLVCHSRLTTDVEAIKPYVCDKPLCLFQYMSLGFGPSIEPEIKSQPYVVDLLVSFCYAGARNSGLPAYPTGLSMMVPNPEYPVRGMKTAYYTERINQSYGSCIASFNYSHNELEIQDSSNGINVKRGDWIAINANDRNVSWHCRVSDSTYYPILKLDTPIMLGVTDDGMQQLAKSNITASSAVEEVYVHVYDRNFDELQPKQKETSIVLLLDLLPGIKDMAKYLALGHDMSLASWVTRLPSAAVALLRWIIASNRSCIMQVDNPDLVEKTPGLVKGEERIQGLNSWMQFRFAMGAPDKEQRFINAIQAETKSQPYPTLFAFHGSSLKNWHSIIREGLHFRDTSHGRAYGHGVYHSPDFQVSSGYTQAYYGSSRYNFEGWPQSALRFDSCLALSEIVNAPTKFVSQTPHYVVQYLDWIQTRYLFVRPGSEDIKLVDEYKLPEILPQDPQRRPSGPDRKQLVLPVTAVPTSRRPSRGMKTPEFAPKPKKPKISRFLENLGKNADAPIDVDALSDATDHEDLLLLIPSTETTSSAKQTSAPKAQEKKKPTEPVLPFTPGPIQNLELMSPPSFATPVASKGLQREFRTLLQVQEAHIEAGTLHELGWYTDPEHMSMTGNLYQWTVCLHSFPMSLPLAKDMKDRGISSVIMEMRFPADYPLSPPFLRIISPRFLPFSQGGGGHVTAGGSICMELLTNTGWSAVSSIESVLLQVRMAIMNLDPKPARLVNGKQQAYGIGEAVDAYKRVANLHGWKIPPGIETTARLLEPQAGPSF